MAGELDLSSEHGQSYGDVTLASVTCAVPALKKIGALDFLPKAGFDELSSMVDESTVAFAYWGALLAVTSDVSNLPAGVRVVDNLSKDVYLLHMDIGVNGHGPVAISRGPMPAVVSEAELSANYQDELPWYHVCTNRYVRASMVRTIEALKRLPGFTEVYVCPSVASTDEVLVLATNA